MSIQPLPRDVVAQIKSSAIITSLNGVVFSLLQNSLDAGASKINISVDYSRGNCSVEDNGHGIAPAAFQEHGALGKLHCEVVVRNTPAPPEQRVLAFPNGTRVLVRDLFGSMPVRVKQRAIEVERAGTSKDFELLISSIVALLLTWPGQVTVALQDSYARRTVSLSTPHAVDWGQSYRTTAANIVSKTTALLTQASLLDHADSTSWVPIGATASGISVRGCVSIRPVATKRVQFIGLGIQPLVNKHQSNFLYEEVNRVFGDSSFGVVEEATVGEDGLPMKTIGFTGKELKLKKGVDRWPMFFLQIMLDTGTGSVDVDDFLDERHQNLAVITDLLQVMVYEFLKKHHFRPRDRERGDLSAEATGSGIPTTLEGRISKAALQEAEIIGQVDQKFILAKVATEPPTTSTSRANEADLMLILIDQHAADERCRVERLLGGYFIPDSAGSGDFVAQTHRLDKPLRFELSGQDGDLLARHYPTKE
ncbi:DNA mismatch repair protein [Collariella sp. IMI 366227]|nr:DNA mismatch repair protein [Collariella sp. IMI 366227]